MLYLFKLVYRAINFIHIVYLLHYSGSAVIYWEQPAVLFGHSSHYLQTAPGKFLQIKCIRNGPFPVC
jgi:hypothetical protein